MINNVQVLANIFSYIPQVSSFLVHSRDIKKRHARCKSRRVRRRRRAGAARRLRSAGSPLSAAAPPSPVTCDDRRRSIPLLQLLRRRRDALPNLITSRAKTQCTIQKCYNQFDRCTTVSVSMQVLIKSIFVCSRA